MRKRGKKEGVQGDLNIERVQFFLSTASVKEGLKKWSTPKGVYLDASEFLDMVCVLAAVVTLPHIHFQFYFLHLPEV